MVEKIRNLINNARERLGRLDRGRVGWYAALAVLLVALGTASSAWRSRIAVRYDITRQTGTADAAQPVNAGATPDPLAVMTTLPQPAATAEPLTFEWPVPGEVIGEYAPDKLVWSETLRQWQTHPALDLSAAAGEAVRACADGAVKAAWEDPLWGNVIQIEHGDGYVSTYANLSTLKLVNVGDAVTAGQAISAVGDSAACEAEMPRHLHFALEKDGTPVDFEKIMR